MVWKYYRWLSSCSAILFRVLKHWENSQMNGKSSWTILLCQWIHYILRCDWQNTRLKKISHTKKSPINPKSWRPTYWRIVPIWSACLERGCVVARDWGFPLPRNLLVPAPFPPANNPIEDASWNISSILICFWTCAWNPAFRRPMSSPCNTPVKRMKVEWRALFKDQL